MPRPRGTILATTTPVNKTRTTRSQSQSQNAFPSGLDLINTRRRMPATSTPKVDLTARNVTKRDVDTAFGFDDSCEVEANYSTIISPIAHAAPKAGAPVWKVNPLTQRNVDLEVPKPTTRPPEKVVEVKKRERKVTKATNLEKQKKKSPKTRSGRKKITASSSKPVAISSEPVPEPVPMTSSASTTTLAEIPEPPPVVVEKEKVQKPPTDFSALLDRYNKDETEVEPELRIDPKKIVRTYGSRKRVRIQEDRDSDCDYDFTKNVRVEFEEKQKQTKRKNTRKGTGKKAKQIDDDLDEEAQKWLQEKNKEFEDVLKAPLVIENSFSD